MVPEKIKPYENKPNAAIEAAKAAGHEIVLPFVAMQAILGSDPVREILSMERIENNVDPYGFLIKPKGAK